MGSGRDKRKKAKGSSTAGHGATKTLEKTQKNAAKLDRSALTMLGSLWPLWRLAWIASFSVYLKFCSRDELLWRVKA